MNYSSAVMLVNPNIRAIHVIYEPEIEGKPKQQRYTFKTLDATIKTNDLVVIPTDTRHGYTVVKVVDTDVEVDFDSTVQLKWIVDKVNLQAYDLVLVEEGKAISAIKESEKRKKREEIKKNLLDMHEEDLKGLAITNMGAPVAIENKTTV